jgi:hypothetical protein
MSLIKCPECGGTVSDKAPVCPHCGVKIAGEVEASSSSHAGSQPSHAPEQAPEPPAEKRPEPSGEKKTDTKAWTIVCVVIVILLAAIGGYCYFTSNSEEREEEMAYQMLDGCVDPLSYEDFIDKYPKSRHIAEIKDRYEELKKEIDTWNRLCRYGDKKQFEDYLIQYPETPYRKEIDAKIDSLDWVYATQSNTVEAYDQYLDNHQDGEHSEECYELRKKAADQQVTEDERAQLRSTINRVLRAVVNGDAVETALLAGVSDAEAGNLIELVHVYNNLQGFQSGELKIKKERRSDGITYSISGDASLIVASDDQNNVFTYTLSCSADEGKQLSRFTLRKVQ